MVYERLLKRYDRDVIVREKVFHANLKGLYRNGKILINRKLDTSTEKGCVLAEELGHHFTSNGDILDPTELTSIKQELLARNWAYEELIKFEYLIKAYKDGISGEYDLAKYLGVTQEFLRDAIKHYNNKYGTYYIFENYTIYFTPALGILEFF